jgi:hypothetical protein
MKWIKQTILVLIVFIFISDNLFSQTNDNKKYLNIRTGFLVNADMMSKDFEYAFYIAPSFLIKRHEIFLGPLLTDRHSGLWSSPQFGCIAGYNFYIFKDPMRVNLYLSYSIQYYEHKADNSDHYGFIVADYCSNTIGFGFNFFFDKKKILSLFNTTGYTFDIVRTKWLDEKAHIGSYWEKASISLGLCVKVGSTKR